MCTAPLNWHLRLKYMGRHALHAHKAQHTSTCKQGITLNLNMCVCVNVFACTILLFVDTFQDDMSLSPWVKPRVGST